MTLFEKVYTALEPLEIPVVLSFYRGSAKQYVTLTVYAEEDFMVFDNENQAELYKFKVTYWREANEKDNSQAIKKLMKNAGFRFMYSVDIFDDGYFGKVFDFQGILTLEELEKGEN
ncbi:hypothetical protein IEO70_02190 [Bacillus sp. AGMB 02131]|uniref:Phage protein n=1 Tax=Peribacillus faecalis TaxID=2772559 RepID=A0A927CSQ3_9BACI|nr:hypothetical protein [Peribacillus faecalis]MBD3107177.1 hypothetical protein [Peribacillus faecalis]